MEAIVQSNPILAVVEQFNAAFNRHAVDELMALMTEDCLFENTFPPPDGELFQGQPAVRAAFEHFFNSSPHAQFDFYDLFACGERACVRWTYRWLDAAGQPGHIQGVDIFRLRAGRIAEKRSYVKG